MENVYYVFIIAYLLFLVGRIIILRFFLRFYNTLFPAFTFYALTVVPTFSPLTALMIEFSSASPKSIIGI